MKEYMSKIELPVSRRSILAGGMGMALAAGTNAANVMHVVATKTTDKIPMRHPLTEFVFEAVVDVGVSAEIGIGPFGKQRVIEIKGGYFEGPGLRGKVLPSGGADRQTIRRDGIKIMDAVYELQTDDGVVISINNKVIVDSKSIPRYAFSAVKATAPDGPYAWLNRVQLVGIHAGSLRPARNAVVIRVFKLV